MKILFIYEIIKEDTIELVDLMNKNGGDKGADR